MEMNINLLKGTIIVWVSYVISSCILGATVHSHTAVYRYIYIVCDAVGIVSFRSVLFTAFQLISCFLVTAFDNILLYVLLYKY